MSRLFPLPVVSLLVLGLWLILAPAPTLGQVLIGAALALLLPRATRGFWPDRSAVRDPLAALRLIGVVLLDIVTANILVARQVLGPPEALKPGFFEVPLDLPDPFVATLLGAIVTMTPGTVSVDIDRTRNMLQVHALHVEDATGSALQIKTRYEAPLRKVFGC
jgi:multicomponent K+:H+ antiporter subunit E